MARNFQPPIILHDAVSLTTATFTAATTDIITDASHGLTEGDKVRLTTSGTLPGGLELLTDYWLFAVTTDTFKLTTQPVIRRASGDSELGLTSYTAVDITSTQSGGTHTYTISSISIPILITDFVHLKFFIAQAGAGSGDDISITIKTSDEINPPDFKQAKSATNQWEEIQVITLEGGDAIDGADPITSISGSNLIKNYAINQDFGRWVAVDITLMDDVTNTVTVKLSCSSND